jgi:hypothetical protein
LQRCFEKYCFTLQSEKMLRSVYIVRFLSGLLLIVFAFSITPKRFLHTAFARHIDNKFVRDSNKPFQLSASGFNCDNDNLVAESTFVHEQYIFQFPLFISFSSYIIKNISFSSSPQIFSLLRGPPVSI